MARSLEPKTIKSAQRVFAVLEYFDSERTSATVTDIAREYGYPQSSASELLSYMVSLGYLRRGQRGRTFHLTMRVAMLGAWVQPHLTRSGRLLRLMDELADETGGSVVLASNTRVRLQCIHAVRRHAEAPRQGDLMDILNTSEGRALLLTCDRGLVRRYVHRLNAEMEDEARRVRYEDLDAALVEASAKGYVRVSADDFLSLAILLPISDHSEQLALSLRAPLAGASEQALVRALRSIVSRTLGLVSVGVPAVAPAPSRRSVAIGF
ncbi:helix-turn-helix domain-containing protein [Sphingomonas profundi]|uniref:helix-turn-helix domain-containing protein n=1 Tax=Alterirhizorhabdus profundi TaxID=2681549 RepID=UPI0018D1EF0C|nr:helix-turn-helix domain-containing protein [Sphingomonas profundi]